MKCSYKFPSSKVLRENQIPYIIEHTQPNNRSRSLLLFLFVIKIPTWIFCAKIRFLSTQWLLSFCSQIVFSFCQCRYLFRFRGRYSFSFIFHCNIDHFINSFHSHVSNYIHAIVRFLDDVHFCGFSTSKIAFVYSWDQIITEPEQATDSTKP